MSAAGHSVRNQARADAERAEGALDRAGPSITPQALKTFANQARRRMRTASGGYRRYHVRALAQRIEVDAKEVRIRWSLPPAQNGRFWRA
jgi:site-specific DNA recombinase